MAGCACLEAINSLIACQKSVTYFTAAVDTPKKHSSRAEASVMLLRVLRLYGG